MRQAGGNNAATRVFELPGGRAQQHPTEASRDLRAVFTDGFYQISNFTDMICYLDKTFCTFYETCDKKNTCSLPLTPQVKANAKKWWGEEGAPIAVFTEKPECHTDSNKEKQ
jgi:hypothetical protein